jgi:molybdate transport system substrate-binding protein
MTIARIAGLVLLAATVGTAAAPPSEAQELTIAAASDLQPVLPALVARFEKETGRRVALAFGSSGTFFSQIQNGAPFDLFFSADVDYTRRLDAAGLVEPGSLSLYATGRIVLWARKDAGIDLSRGLQSLSSPGVRKIAIANPAHAPYGRAAVAAMQHDKVYDAVRGKLIFGENVTQAAQFVESGNADVGIVALSLAMAPALRGAGVMYEIPTTFYPPIDQSLAILRASRHKEVAKEFLAFFDRPEARREMQAFGFARPAAPARH